MKKIIFASVIAALASCAGWQPALINQASFDHRCAEKDVQILRESGDGNSRTVDMKICGRERRYRDLGGRIVAWIDITDGTPVPSDDKR